MPYRAVNLSEMVSCVSRALDLLHPSVQHHHSRVAVIASRLARQLGLPEDVRSEIVIAGALHDVAAVLEARPEMEEFSFAEPHGDARPLGDGLHRHALDGALLLGRFTPFAGAARIVKHHHVAWAGGRGQEFERQPVASESHLLNLADTVAALLPTRDDVLSQRQVILAHVRAASGTRFNPEHVSALEAVAGRESFWLDLVFDAPAAFEEEARTAAPAVLGVQELLELARLLGELIDVRSPFTATHSACVSEVAEALASALGMAGEDCQMIRIAGLLHDLGKLAVPPALLDKPGRLTPEEYSVVQTHAYHTFQIMRPVRCLETITAWASFHHERLDGRGYPFRPAELSLGSRIVAVADLFTALSEDRPYRAGMDPSEVTRLLAESVAQGAIDGDVVEVLCRDRERFERVRRGVGAGHAAGC